MTILMCVVSAVLSDYCFYFEGIWPRSEGDGERPNVLHSERGDQQWDVYDHVTLARNILLCTQSVPTMRMDPLNSATYRHGHRVDPPKPDLSNSDELLTVTFDILICKESGILICKESGIFRKSETEILTILLDESTGPIFNPY